MYCKHIDYIILTISTPKSAISHESISAVIIDDTLHSFCNNTGPQSYLDKIKITSHSCETI